MTLNVFIFFIYCTVHIILHFFHRTGEYIIEVIMSNLVSSGSLTGHIFVLEELCQPPPVKNMGPNKIQVQVV